MTDLQPEDRQETTGTGTKSLLRRLYRPGPLILFFTLIVAGLLSIAWFALKTPTSAPAPVASAPKETVPGPTAKPRQYEAELGSDLEDRVKQVDLAIIQAMRAAGLGMDKLDLQDVELRHHEGRTYHYQELALPSPDDRKAFMEAIRANLTSRAPKAVLSEAGQDRAMVTIFGIPTHKLLFAPSHPVAEPEIIPGPKVAVVIDDVGENMGVLKGLLGLDIPLTYAVWPNASHTDDAISLISRENQDMLVHFPMEPRGYPEVDPGDDALFVGMTKSKITALVARNLNRVPKAIGVNNHMGSRLTEHSPELCAALQVFHDRNLFFLDSLTTPKSVGRICASKIGVPFYERDVFLDNVKDPEAIVLQLRKAERLALKRGHAIAIGHPYRETLAALRSWAKKHDRKITIVSLSSLPPERP